MILQTNPQEQLNGSKKMVRIYVVDNGGQWTHREWRVLRDLDVDTKIISNTAKFDEIKEIDGLILSGGAPRVGLEGKLGNTDEILEKADFPIMGICAGHQYIARFFKGEAKPAKKPEYGKVELTIIKEDPLFKDVAEKSIVWESHNDEVSKLPKNFVNLAKSMDCEIQAMRHKQKPFYGLQFHPEVNHTEYGLKIFQNFLEICKQSI